MTELFYTGTCLATGSTSVPTNQTITEASEDGIATGSETITIEASEDGIATGSDTITIEATEDGIATGSTSTLIIVFTISEGLISKGRSSEYTKN